jgi:hypothetical protein
MITSDFTASIRIAPERRPSSVEYKIFISSSTEFNLAIIENDLFFSVINKEVHRFTRSVFKDSNDCENSKYFMRLGRTTISSFIMDCLLEQVIANLFYGRE